MATGPVRWGVLGDAAIGRRKVIPGMQQAPNCQILALASRDVAKARRACEALGIPRAYGSYEELLADSDVEAVYIPLPNHLHVPWTIKAAEAGKHVLCEKPIALTVEEAEALVEARDRTGMLIQEAFMVRTAPQWLRVRELVRAGRIGRLRSVTWLFSYMNTNPDDVRNRRDIGGGGIYDIGCYPITTSRFLFDAEPRRVVALVERDPRFGTDRLASVLMDFEAGQASFTCSTQLVPFQIAQVLGTEGRIEIQVPCNLPPDEPAHLLVDDGHRLRGAAASEEVIQASDQYTHQGEAFAAAVRGEREQPVPLEDAVANTRVIAAVYRSAASGAWEDVG